MSARAVILIFSIVSLASSTSAQPAVRGEGGAIFVEDGKIATRVRTNGTCKDPVLSPKGDIIVFTCVDHGRANISVAFKSQEWRVETLVRFPLTVNSGEYESAFCVQPSFDSASIFFMSDFSATAFMLLRVQISEATAVEIGPGTEYSEIDRGPLSGDLVLVQRAWGQDRMRYPKIIANFNLFSAKGKSIRTIGAEPVEVERAVGYRLHFCPDQ